MHASASYRLGWIPDVPDVRDVPFAATFRVPYRLPPSSDIRSGCSPIEDQGALGSCTAQALIGALEFLGLRAGDKTDLSRLFVYYNERAAQGTVRTDSGAMLRTGIKVLARQGVCRESLWPYAIDRFARLPSKASYAEALGHKVTAYQRLSTLDDCRSCLAMGLPFVFGFSVYEHVQTASVARTGIIRIPRPSERLVGGHAVLAVGYDDRRRLLAFRNSWGPSWGLQGYGLLPYAYLESRALSDDFWTIQGTESTSYLSRRRSA